ncbi:MAG TPA: amino acid ABC transporter ATP-binding protein [Candidatus Caccosoma faecigallinarum]|uniref:Amino acid ABC transporter ATP-binding protein n=1 Tax=Candidatus Caccosoma faecigallinarum TaxID=2840720 RepID=A0A9D1G7U7_9FIRM|nr:amino acid ABC transporter ATP-binding protein [Firmicutes bacterium CAG:631]HIT17000.1 amino acid ABC transporter ATP-binding protein [Candidatus Caccosoma faecigallinarum]
MDKLFEIQDLCKSFGDKNILKGVSLDIFPQEVVCIIGPSGAGKSTFLRCLNLLERPTNGTILFKNEDILKIKNIDSYRAKVGMVFQQFNLFLNKNVLQNCILAQRKVLKRKKDEAFNIAIESLKKVGMLDYKDYSIQQISGGQKQRVAISRVLCMHPEVILMDEPTSALDPVMVNEVLQVIQNLAKEGRSMIIVTHEMRFAKEVATKVVYMEDGKIIEVGSSDDIFLHPKNEKTKAFLRMNQEKIN